MRGVEMVDVDLEVRPCRREAAHDLHFLGSAEAGAVPFRCLGAPRPFYRDWEKTVRHVSVR
jgi:hypothetical protein